MSNTVGQESNASSENKVSWLPRKVRPIGWAAGRVKFRLRPKKSFSPEFKDEAVKMVVETSRPIASVAKELGIGGGTLGSWVRAYRREHAREEAPLALEEAPLTSEIQLYRRLWPVSFCVVLTWDFVACLAGVEAPGRTWRVRGAAGRLHNGRPGGGFHVWKAKSALALGDCGLPHLATSRELERSSR